MRRGILVMCMLGAGCIIPAALLGQTKIGGYVQTEWQHFDQRTNVGGKALNSDDRKNFFTIRRGRLKVDHTIMSGSDTSIVLTLAPDFTERAVEIKDAFTKFYLVPGTVTVTAGRFLKPNLETELSSPSRESPERSQVVTTFYNGFRDLGVMATLTGDLGSIKPQLQAGVFNGTGQAPEVDAYKDLTARLIVPIPTGENWPRTHVGASIYHGGIPQEGDSVIISENGSTTTTSIAASGEPDGWGNRSHIGFEAQIGLDVLPFGTTILRGEYMMGKRPTTATEARPLQIRRQAGYYAYFVQNIGTHVQLVAKYDHFDRNTELAGTEVKTSADAAFGVLAFGGGLTFGNFKFMAWYEMPTLAADEISPGDDVKDNKTTLRGQVRF